MGLNVRCGTVVLVVADAAKPNCSSYQIFSGLCLDHGANRRRRARRVLPTCPVETRALTVGGRSKPPEACLNIEILA
jgi:hypothetical protein